MMAKKGLLKRMGPIVVAAVVLSACAAPRAQYAPYPSQGKSAIEYNRDLAECRDWARGQSGASSQRALNQGAQGALGGAALGALVGVLLGGGRGAGIGAALGAGVGAGAGGLYGSQQAQRTYDLAYRDCLNKKGY